MQSEVAATTTVKKKLYVLYSGVVGQIFSFSWCFCYNEPLGNRVPGCLIEFSTTVQVDSTEVELAVNGCKGIELFDRLRPLSYPNTDVFLLCFAVSNPNGLERAELEYFPEIQKYCPGVPVILVATLIESRDDQSVINDLAKTNEEPVTMETGQAVADRLGVFAYMECSENTGQGMKELQRTAALAALSHTPTAETTKCCMIL